MTSKVNRLLIAIVLLLLLIIGFIKVAAMRSNTLPQNGTQILFTLSGTDKAMYAPGDKINIHCSIDAPDYRGSFLKLQVSVFHNELSVLSQNFTLTRDQFAHPQISFPAPSTDFTGYLVKIAVLDDHDNELASDTTAVDVSSSWVKFPRYGYVCDFEPSVSYETLINTMNTYHINAIEYYDWHHLHHEPLPAEYSKEHPTDWTDWAGRLISASTVTGYIAAARERNMVSMAYNMIYAGTDSFFTDKDGNPTPACQWQLFFRKGNTRGSGPFVFTMGDSPSGNGHLYFVNPLNPEWQEYIFAQENRAIEALGFDGWHGDTVGEYGELTNADGEPLGYDVNGEPIYLVKDTYRAFLNNAKAALGDKYLSFNPVGAQGNEQANTSNTDVLYAEFWPWDSARDGELFNTYHSILREVERSNEDSKPYSIDGKGKSLVVKAYINTETKNQYMNDAAVLLMDAVTYAAGGGRLELGNGDHMLHTAYYPDDDIPMSDTLHNAMVDMCNFSVAYENLLRDGQSPTNTKVEIADIPVSNNGESYTIWAYTKEDANYQILHLINLRNNNNQWADEKGRKKDPEILENLSVKYYTDKPVSSVYIASPDFADCTTNTLGFSTGSDGDGNYIEFTVPSLKYWDMIYMK